MVHGYEIRDFTYPLALSYFILQISSEKSTQWFSALSVKEFVHFFKKTQSELNEPVSGSSGRHSFLMFLSQPPS